MQPDPTPDLDELTRLHRDASSPGQIVTSHKMTVWEFDLCCESRKAMPWLIRAARERDELRARAERAEADLAESKRLAEKAEARVKELEARCEAYAALALLAADGLDGLQSKKEPR